MSSRRCVGIPTSTRISRRTQRVTTCIDCRNVDQLGTNLDDKGNGIIEVVRRQRRDRKHASGIIDSRRQRRLHRIDRVSAQSERGADRRDVIENTAGQNVVFEVGPNAQQVVVGEGNPLNKMTADAVVVSSVVLLPAA